MSDSIPLENELICVKQAAFGYGDKIVVRVDELRLRLGSCLGIFGPNGSGKTTMVRGITGLLAPIAGSVTRRPDRAVRFGYMPQYRGIDLSWPMSGFDAAALASSARSRWGWIGRSQKARIREAMIRLDAERLSHQSFSQLSGGQQQRLLLAGALAADPDALILDEPTDGLDVRSRQNLLELLQKLTAGGLSIVMISHDVEDLLSVCNEVGWLHAADVPGEPSRVEVIHPNVLAERILIHRRGA